MVIVNNELNFAFNVNEPYREVKKEAYSALGVNSNDAGRILNAFVVLDKDNKITRSIALIRDAKFTDEEGFKKIVSTNVLNMMKLGFTILNSYHVSFTNGRSAEKFIFQTKDGKKLAFIITGVHGVAVGSSAVISVEGDELDKEITHTFASITEF